MYKKIQTQDIKNKDMITILCIGESMTEGQYPKFLERNLKNKGFTKILVIDKGQSAVTSDYLINQIERNILTYNPNIIVAMMGLMDDTQDTIIKVKKIPSKLISFFYFYKLFNIGIYERINSKSNNNVNTFQKGYSSIKMNELNKKFNIANDYYNNKEYDKAMEIFTTINYPSPIQSSIINSIINCLKLSENTKELKNFILTNMKEDPWFNVQQCVEFAEKTQNIEIIKQLFPIDNEVIFKKVVLGNIVYAYQFRDTFKKLNLPNELNKLNKLLDDIENKDIIFKRKQLQPFSKTAISNYKKLAKICKAKNIKLIVMQYPTISIIPFKDFLKEFDNIVFVSNEEIFKKALQTKKYFEIFKDDFAGNFGHCTETGNKLIAENLAKTIQKIIN